MSIEMDSVRASGDLVTPVEKEVQAGRPMSRTRSRRSLKIDATRQSCQTITASIHRITRILTTRRIGI